MPQFKRPVDYIFGDRAVDVTNAAHDAGLGVDEYIRARVFGGGQEARTYALVYTIGFCFVVPTVTFVFGTFVRAAWWH